MCFKCNVAIKNASLITFLQTKIARLSFGDVPNERFDAKKIREAMEPPFRRREMARRMGISDTYLRSLEEGRYPWLPHRIKDFKHEIELWKKNPDAKPRKKWGRKHGCRADGSPARGPSFVPHSHHEIVGIG
jgi:hypothetical protein